MTHSDEFRPHVVQMLGDFGLGGDGRVARDLSAALVGRGRGARTRAAKRRTRRPGGRVLQGDTSSCGLRSLLRAAVGLREIEAREALDLLHIPLPSLWCSL
jgi:hypothetical protein